MSVATQIAAIEAALEIGARSTTDESGRRIEFHSLRDMLDALAALNSQEQTSGTGRNFAFLPMKAGDAK